MEHITTYTGEDFTPLSPNAEQIHIEDIAHALSMMCRANGHFIHFYSVAQHSINCANEAETRGLSERVRLACLLHDGSEAYLSDITRPVKKHLSKYLDIEKRLQDLIYCKFLGSSLTEDETACVEQIDRDMLVCEFNTLMKKKVFDDCLAISSKPSFEYRDFMETERDFLELYNGKKVQTTSVRNSLKQRISDIEEKLQRADRNSVIDIVESEKVAETLSEKLRIKQLSAQVDVAIHAYGILLALSKIMDKDETIEYLSLGAGNTGKAYDVSTSKRVAEFKFAIWGDSSNTIRQNNIFKDFLELATSNDTDGKEKYIYCLCANEVISFLSNSERNLRSVLSRNPMNKNHPDVQSKYKTVKAFYQAHKDVVKIIELSDYIDLD